MWPVIEALRPSFTYLDEVAEKRGTFAHHEYLDRWLGRLRGRTIFFPYGFFPDGYGNFELPSLFIDDFVGGKVTGLPHVDVTVGQRVPVREAGIELQDGHFFTPFVHASTMLPIESHIARFQIVRPLPSLGKGSTLTAEEAAVREGMLQEKPVAIILAGTGEQGYQRRRHFTACPLARLGVSSIILESPYYGSRRPAKQVASKLRNVSDLPTLGRVTIDEAKALIEFIGRIGEFGPIVLTGNSMGGLHSAMTAALTPSHELGVVSWLGPPTADHVFCMGVLSESCEWNSLAKQADDPRLEAALLAFEDKLLSTGVDPVALRSVADSTIDHQCIRQDAADSKRHSKLLSHLAKRQLSRFLTITDINNFPPPRRPDATVFVAAKHDQYIPAQGAIADKWELLQSRWPGASVHWIRGGHVSAILFPKLNPARMVTDVVKRLLRR